MNKFDFLQKIEDAETLIASARYDEAVEICDELNLDLVKEPRKLQNLAKAYEKCKRFRDAERLLLLAHEQVPKSRGILFHLCNVAIKAGDIQDAKIYYNDFCELVPRDARRHILAYRIAVAERQPDDELIRILEKYLSEETDDRWMYVLAELYAKQGRVEESAGVCNAIILWFDSGRYVMRARNLLTSLGYEVPEEADDFYDEEAAAEYGDTGEEGSAAEAPAAAVVTVGEIEEAAEEPEALVPEEAATEETATEETAEPETPETAAEEVVEAAAEAAEELPLVEEAVPAPEEVKNIIPESEIVIPNLANKIQEAADKAKEAEEAPAEPEVLIPEADEETAGEAEEAAAVSEEADTAEAEEAEAPAEAEAPETAAPVSEENPASEEEPEEEHVIMTITDPDWAEKIRGEVKEPKDEFGEAPEFAFEIPDEIVPEAAAQAAEAAVTEASEAVPEVPLKSPEEIRKEEEAARAAAEKAAREAKAEAIRAEIIKADLLAAAKEQEEEETEDDGHFEPVEYGAALNKELSKRKEDRLQFGSIPVEPEMSEHIWHFIAFGETDEYSLACAKEHIREISETNSNCPVKMLKISAEKIGSASIINSLDRFLGSVVVVEHVSQLSDEQLTEFSKVLDTDDMSLLVIFTDTKEGILNALRRVPQLEHSFTAVYEGRDYTADDLLEIAEIFLRSEEAKFTPEAEELVLKYAEELLRDRKGFYRNHILDYAAQALDAADWGGFLGFGAGKLDKDGTLIVDAKHFKKAEKE